MAGAHALKDGKNHQKTNLAEAIGNFMLSQDKRVEMFIGTINNSSASTVYSLHDGYVWPLLCLKRSSRKKVFKSVQSVFVSSKGLLLL
jgi:uncharacterized membrane protein